MHTKSLITIKEARKLLGVESKLYSDEQVKKIIADFSTIARLYIIGSKNIVE